MIRVLMELAGQFAYETATKEGFEVVVPFAVWERLMLNARDLNRFGVAQAGDSGALLLQSPAGVITIRRRTK